MSHLISHRIPSSMHSTPTPNALRKTNMHWIVGSQRLMIGFVILDAQIQAIWLAIRSVRLTSTQISFETRYYNFGSWWRSDSTRNSVERTTSVRRRRILNEPQQNKVKRVIVKSLTLIVCDEMRAWTNWMEWSISERAHTSTTTKKKKNSASQMQIIRNS